MRAQLKSTHVTASNGKNGERPQFSRTETFTELSTTKMTSIVCTPYRTVEILETSEGMFALRETTWQGRSLDTQSCFRAGVSWIAEVKCDESEQHEEHCANARLIAAAPALLKSLESLLAYLREFWPCEPLFSTYDDRQAMEIADAEAAIRKAKGEAA